MFTNESHYNADPSATLNVVALVVAIIAASATVALSDWTARLRRRRELVETAALELPMLLPKVLVGIADPQEGYKTVDTSMGSEWDAQRERVLILHNTARVMARWPMRRAKKIRAAAEQSAAQFAAAELDFRLKDRRIRTTDLMDFLDADLHVAVFGARGDLDKAVESHRRTN